MKGNLVIEYHAIITWLIVACLVFILTAAAGTYISERIKRKMNPPKESPPGSVEFCANCKARQSVVADLPGIKKKQEDRDITMNTLGTTIAIIQTGITSLDERVKKIFNMIETGYKDEIEKLRQVVRDQKTEIERLKK